MKEEWIAKRGIEVERPMHNVKIEETHGFIENNLEVNNTIKSNFLN